MRDYELTLIIDPDLSAEDQKKVITKVKKIIIDLKGKVEKLDEWGKKPLSYPIKKKNMGSYFYLEIKLPAESANQIDKKLKIEESVMRYLIVSLSTGR
ncbi:MAG TPA: 30S ribosomal protein S6 [Nevskiaceae bacterium]|nr:30S ribosomal protein S6 [Nevskiaceae bacterium]